jgi:AcrR family transcriptional regulator
MAAKRILLERSVAEKNIMSSSLARSAPIPRKPKQARSRQSLQKMLDTAKVMLAEKGYSEFTLKELCKRSNVSIGSIYHRFESKQELVRRVQAEVLEAIEQEHAVLINRLRRRDLRLHELVPEVVSVYGGFLRRHAPILRVFMDIAPADRVIEEVGKRSHAQAMIDVRLLLLDCRDEIGHPDPERAVDACFNVIYASLGRYLGLGTAADVSGQGDWNTLLGDLSLMALLFLAGPRGAEKAA